jgi:Ca2+-binding EF-hand superfamily protein
MTLIAASVAAGAEPAKRHRGEFLQMWDAIVSGAPMNGASGWFKPSESRHSWQRLCTRFDKNRDGRIVTAEWDAAKEFFAALDRDRDNAITADDLDWSENATYFRQLGIAQQVIRQGDNDGNRKLTKEEWAALFEQAAKGKTNIDVDDLRNLLFAPMPPRKGGGGMPPKSILLYGLLTGEIGSGAEGPSLDTIAPDFTLKSPDGKEAITLSSHRGKRPVVLIFGSFT